MKLNTFFKITTAIVILMCVALTANAQYLLGSFQGASDPTDAGWVDPNNSDPITTDPTASFVAAGVSSYPLSLNMSAAGQAGSFGYPSLQLDFSPAQVAAFNTNSWVTFTFSVPAETNTGGYAQIYNLVLNAPGYGYNNQSWANAMEMGNTNNTSAGGDPNYYFNAGSNGMETMVITYNYSSVTNAIIAGGESYLQMRFQGNQGGGGSTNFLFNNVVLSTTPFGSAALADTIIVDQFNPTNNSYAGTNYYNQGYITNVYGTNWFGDAMTNISWDPNTDAGGGPANSGSLRIDANFFGANGNSQWAVHDKGPSFTYAGINPPITNDLTLVSFQFDVKYAPGSALWTNGSSITYGHLEFGVVPPYSPATIGFTNIPATNSGWTHVVIPLNPSSNPNLASISGVFFKQDGNSYGTLVGRSTLWLDNLEFTYTNLTAPIPPPTVGIQTAKPGLRIFAASTANTYDREELATVDENQSWIGGSYPVSYSFKLLDYPANIEQSQVFLVPVNTSGQANMGNNGTLNEYIEYQASNTLWMIFGPSTNNTVIATLQWKTNLPNANCNMTALTITNSTAVGTWTLTFNSANAGTLTAPGAFPAPFTITDPHVSTDFTNPLVAYFGLQPNSTAGEGEYEDWGSITVSGVSGADENEDFTKESGNSITASGYWSVNAESTAATAGAVLVSTNDTPAYWVDWTLPAVNYLIGESTNVSSANWINPAYYSSYNDQTSPRGAASQFGNDMWVLIPNDDLPTKDGGQSEPLNNISPTAFFLATTNQISP
jgi:hypothetical protein